MSTTDIEETALMILEAPNAVEARDIPKKLTNEDIKNLPIENQPFLYASGNWGPTYISIKGLVGRKKIIKSLIQALAVQVAKEVPYLDFIAGNATGGMVPGWILSEELEKILGKTVPYVYVRETRKKGGQKELVTGIADNPEIPAGANAIVVEELVNFAQTTCNSTEVLRDMRYRVTHGATVLFYENPAAIQSLREINLKEIFLLTVPELFRVAEKHEMFVQKIMDDYWEFQKNPLKWQAARGLKQVEEGGTV